MNFFDFVLLSIISYLSLWFVQMISKDNFSATIFSRFVAAIFFVLVQMAFGFLYLFLKPYAPGISIVFLTIFLVQLNPLPAYLTFLLGDALLPGFQVINHRLLVRCSLVFYGFNFLGSLFVIMLQFFGAVAFGSLFYSPSRRRNDWFYDEWFYDRYFY